MNFYGASIHLNHRNYKARRRVIEDISEHGSEHRCSTVAAAYNQEIRKESAANTEERESFTLIGWAEYEIMRRSGTWHGAVCT